MFSYYILVCLFQLIGLGDKDASASSIPLIKGSNVKHELNKLLEGDLKKKIADDEILIINIWQTTCGPCIVEVPQLNRLVSKYGKYKVRFLAFSDQDRFYLDLLLDKKKDFQFNYEHSWGNIEAVEFLKSLDKKQKGIAIPIHITVHASGKVGGVLLGAAPEHIQEIEQFIIGNVKNNQ